MVDETKTMGFMARCKVFFGFHEGQSLGDFAKEIKALSTKDKEELCAMFNAAGMPTEIQPSLA